MRDVAAHGGRSRWLLGVAAVALMAAPVAAAAPAPQGFASERAGFFEIPAFGSCIDGNRLTVRVRPVRGDRWVRATVWINGRRVKMLKGRRITKPLTLTGLSTPGIALGMSAASADGRLAAVLRTYRACWALPPDGRYGAPGGGGLSFTVTDGGTRIRDVAGDVALACTSVGGDVDRLAIAEIPIGSDGSFTSVTTRTGQFRGSDATFTYTFGGRSLGMGFAGTYHVDVVYAGGAARCTSTGDRWSATRVAP